MDKEDAILIYFYSILFVLLVFALINLIAFPFFLSLKTLMIDVFTVILISLLILLVGILISIIYHEFYHW